MSARRASTVPAGSLAKASSVGAGGGEDSEGTFTLQCFNQAGGFEGSCQGGEAAICHGHFHNILGRQQHGVDDVNGAVAGEDIVDDDLGVIGHDLVHVLRDGDVLALDGGDGFHLEHLGGGQVLAGDMVEQDVGQSRDISQEGFHGTGRQHGEGVIGGGKDGEGAFALAVFQPAGSFKGGNQGGEVFVCMRQFQRYLCREAEAPCR